MSVRNDSPAVLTLLGDWVEAGWLRALDQAFAAFLVREAPDADPLLLLAAALASHQLGRGHSCLELDVALADAAGTLAIPPESPLRERDPAPTPITPAQRLAGLGLARWLEALRHPQIVGDGEGNSPLVLVGTRLYLRRYWRHEQSVRRGLDRLLTTEQAPGAQALRAVRPVLGALFMPPPASGSRPAGEGPDWQKAACALALRTRLTVITGGPGTGKTTTVVKLLALLQHLALGEDGGGRPLRIRLAAPTGKAAARLNASIADAVQGLALGPLSQAAAVRAAIPTEVATVHRLLGATGPTRRLRHDADHPLPLDVLVLDEASMVDLEMMAAVLDALPSQARLVLLGDKDQLASVEAGNVLGALCSRADGGHYLASTRDWLLDASGEAIPEALMDGAGHALDQSIVKLRRSWRFDASSGIGRLAEAVNTGDLAQLQSIRALGAADLGWLTALDSDAALRKLVLHGASDSVVLPGIDPGPVGPAHYLQVLRARRPPHSAPRADFDAWARDVIAACSRFQLLCAVRQGPQGVERMNERIAALLHAEGLIESAQGWYLGRPVMVTRNDYNLGLMNGDVGITLALPAPDAAEGELLRVAFTAPDGSIRWVLPSRLQAVETVFAMTVHKSQGSEFAHAALLLPHAPSRVMTRELVYTGITRSKTWFTLAGSMLALEQAVARPTRRAGGLLVGGQQSERFPSLREA